MTYALASFFDSQTWVVVRNVLIFFLVVFWLSVGREGRVAALAYRMACSFSLCASSP